MTKEQLETRIELLTDIHHYTHLHHRKLSDGERICLTQERVALMHCLETGKPPKYVLPAKLEEKVQKIKQHLIDDGWIKPPFTPIY